MLAFIASSSDHNSDHPNFEMYRFFIVLLITCTTPGMAAFAAGPSHDENPWQAILQWDNDLLTGSDRDYTNGARIALLRNLDPDESTHNWLQQALYQLSGADPDAPIKQLRVPEQTARSFAWGFGLTQLMFTPEDPTALRAPAGQRPYASWLGLETSLHVKSTHAATSATLAFGTTGKYSYGQQAQDWVHTNISGSPIFQGWDSQVPGQFTLNLHLDHQRRIQFLDATHDWPLEMNGYHEWGAALGNFRTEAYLGSLIRAGYRLPQTYGIPRVQIGSHGHALFSPEQSGKGPFSIFGFAALRAALVAHDITLDGPLWRDVDTGVASLPWVGELLLGLGIRWGYYELSLSRSYRSDEFSGQNKNQSFGSVMLRADFPF
ncbi:MAG: lipid A 3-O-deacylase [Lentimonas sp.]